MVKFALIFDFFALSNENIQSRCQAPSEIRRKLSPSGHTGPHTITATHQYTVSVYKFPVPTQDTFWTLSFLTNKFIRRPYFKISQLFQ